ncbi:MAG: hypothetical protein JNM63_08505, partial [Spirochaetia bacterium]|nr:hypothetical protein [Spirochaetia bacterium]
AAHSGRAGVRVNDSSEKAGSSLASARMAVKAGAEMQLSWYSRLLSGSGIAVYTRYYDADGKPVALDAPVNMNIVSGKEWKENTAEISVPRGAVEMEIWIHSFSRDRVVADFDDFDLVAIDASQPVPPRWAAQYKIHPGEKNKLTPADIVGPDGIVYPNWTHVGVSGGIPSLAITQKLELKNETDIAAILEAEATKLKNGGVLQLPAGIFYVSRPVRIRQSSVVIRGSGRDKTRLVFNYQVPRGKIYFQNLKPGDTVGLASWIEIHANPEGLTNLTLSCEGKVLSQSVYYPAHWGLTFSMRTSVAGLIAKCGEGGKKVTATLLYRSGETVESSIDLMVVKKNIGDEASMYPAAIEFIGRWRNPDNKTNALVRDGLRGDKKLLLPEGHALVKGDRIRIEAPTTKRWNDLVKNAALWGSYRENMYEVTSVQGNEIGISEPLRLEFPTVDGSFVQKIEPLEKCGVEDLTLEQTENIWTSGVVFSGSWNCWIKGVAVIKPGRFPFYFPFGKYGEVRDCEFKDAWWKGGGGTAYVGFERSYDCLLDGVVASELRHAPNLNWAASGCVFRNMVAEGSDGQWHCGWANENLFENVVIRSGTNGGGYGYGLFSTAPEDNAHGPIGPRNVVYRCDIRSPKDGLILNGMNEGWILAYNRFVIEKGKGVVARETSFDHIFRNNFFAIQNPLAPAFQLNGRSCSGWEVSGNRFYGVKIDEMVGGSGKPLVFKDNQSIDYSVPERPEAPVPSIFEWQKKNAAEPE